MALSGQRLAPAFLVAAIGAAGAVGCTPSPYQPETTVISSGLAGDSGNPGDADIPDAPWWNAQYQYRVPVVVRSGIDAVPASYTVLARLRHNQLVLDGKSQADGDDVRVVYYDGATNTEISRITTLEGFNCPTDVCANGTGLLFRMVGSLGAEDSLAGYFIYYGNALADLPPDDQSNVFFYSTAFESQAEFDSDWTVQYVEDVPAAVDYQITDGDLRKGAPETSNTVQQPFVNDKIVLTSGGPIVGFHAEFNYSPSVPTGGMLDPDLIGVGSCTNDGNANGFYAGVTGGGVWYTNAAQGQIGAGYFAGPADNDFITTDVVFDPGAEHTMIVELTRARLSIWQVTPSVGLRFINEWDTGITTPGYFCLGINSMKDMDINWLWMRRLVEEEPTTQLAAEQVVP